MRKMEWRWKKEARGGERVQISRVCDAKEEDRRRTWSLRLRAVATMGQV